MRINLLYKKTTKITKKCHKEIEEFYFYYILWTFGKNSEISQDFRVSLNEKQTAKKFIVFAGFFLIARDLS